MDCAPVVADLELPRADRIQVLAARREPVTEFNRTVIALWKAVFVSRSGNQCVIYPTRPNCCVALQAGDEQCQGARSAVEIAAARTSCVAEGPRGYRGFVRKSGLMPAEVYRSIEFVR